MKNKRVAALFIAVIILISVSATAFALEGISIVDLIESLSGVDTSKFNVYSEQDWATMSADDRSKAFEFVVSSLNGRVIDSDFCNDPSASYTAYDSLIKRGVIGYDFADKGVTMQKLERDGIVDFGLGYCDDGHSSGGFGDGTVADTLNDDFIDYVQQYPYSGNGNNAYVYLSNGNYCVISFLCKGNNFAPHIVGLDDTYSLDYGWLQIDLYSSDGLLLNTQYNDCRDSLSCNGYSVQLYAPAGQCPFWDFEVLDSSSGAYRLKRYGYQLAAIETPIYYCPLLVNSVSVSDSNAVDCYGVDENGNKIDLTLNSDGVTYEGSTYNYNDDNSVTINGNRYNISVNPNNVDENYYNQFLSSTLNNYYNYYTSSSTNNFDGKDILSALKSIFTSLESFRTSAYTSFRQLGDYIRSLSSTVSSCCNKIVKAIKELNTTVSNLDISTEDKKNDFNAKWLNVIGKFKKKFQVEQISSNINNCYTAMFGADYQSTEGGVVASVSYSSVSEGENGDTVVTTESRNVPITPVISVNILGHDYNLLSSIGAFAPYMETVKGLISAFISIVYFISLYRSLPSLIGPVSGIMSSDFSSSSNHGKEKN